MRIKELFTVPEGKKVTEKAFGRVLVSSICSILLCMACLAGTTWAWFSVSVENKGNVIQIATVTADVEIFSREGGVQERTEGGYVLEAGSYAVTIKLSDDGAAADGFSDGSRPVYVVLTAVCGEKAESRCVTFSDGTTEKTIELTVCCESATVSFLTSWIKPEVPDAQQRLLVGVSPAEAETGAATEGATESPAETVEAP